MANDQTAQITFEADFSSLTDGLQDASRGVTDFGDQTSDTFDDLGAAISKTAALAPELAEGFQAIDSASSSAFDAMDGKLQQAVQEQAQAAQQTQQQWQKAFQPIDRAFDNLVTGFVRGTQTWQQAMQKTGQSIEAEFIESAEHMATQWLATEAAKTAATQAGALARESADGAGQDASLTSHLDTAIKHIETDAQTVYSNVFAFLSPELGPFAAVPAIAAAGTVIAAELALPSAAGGWVVPQDTLAKVHENEMILPANLSKGIAGMIAQGSSQGGGDTHNHFNVNVAANGRLNADDLSGMHDAVIAVMQKASRNGAFGGMRR